RPLQPEPPHLHCSSLRRCYHLARHCQLRPRFLSSHRLRLPLGQTQLCIAQARYQLVVRHRGFRCVGHSLLDSDALVGSAPLDESAVAEIDSEGEGKGGNWRSGIVREGCASIVALTSSLL
ncbi:hypothetical protein L917_08591, partial [Phytophthora nicotianae]